MNSVEDRCKDLMGSSIVVNGKDFGVAVDFFCITDNSFSRFIIVTDKSIKIDAGSYFRFLSDLHLKKVYPQGTDYAKRMSGPKAKSHRIEYVPGKNIRNMAAADYKGNNKRGGN